MAARDDAGKAARVTGWMSIDPNNNGHVSLAEADAWVQKALMMLMDNDQEGAQKIYKALQPSYIRAFNDAKDLTANRSAPDGHYVEKREFRGLIAYLCLYAVMYDAFALMDGSGGTVDDKTHDDRKLTLDEWKTGYKKVANHGFVGLKEAGEGDEAAAEAIFKEMNTGRDETGKEYGNDNVVMLTEFTAWIQKKEADAGTAWGKLLTAGE
jgi:hypothetical protein